MQNPRFFSLSAYQRNRMLAAALDPNTTRGYHSLNTIRWAIRITPGVSHRLLRRAFGKLVMRHDSLRLRLVEHRNDWRAEILAQHPTGLIVEDLGPMTAEAQMVVIRERCAVPMTALDPALFEMRLMKFGRDGDVILTRAQHTIIDGYSIAILLEELLKLVLHMPVTGRALSHGEFITLRERQLQERTEQKRAFWEDALLPVTPPLNLGRKKKGLPPLTRQNMGNSARLDDILSEAASKHLGSLSKTSGVSVFCYLQAAFAEALCAAAGADEVLLLSMLGRQETVLASFVGPGMQAMRIKYRVGDGAVALSEMLSRGAEMMPTTVFDPGMPLSALNHQFFVNMPNPVGRMSNSPFHKIFESAFSGKFSAGFASVERIDIPLETESEFELQLSVQPNRDGPQATLISEAASWDISEMEVLAKAMNAAILA